MTDYDYDLFVIGAGSGGVRAARTAAAAGARVGIAEERYFGGTCVNVGCVPKKLYTYAAHFSEDFQHASAYGWQLPGAARFDWDTLRTNKDREISRLNGIYRNLLANHGVEIHEGRATLQGPDTVLVNRQLLRARHILIAVGGWPFVPMISGRELAISSNEFFTMPTLPRRVVVVGGGYIGLELAGIMAGLGSEVTLLHRGDALLTGFDEEVRALITEETARLLNLRLQREVVSISGKPGALHVNLNDGSTVDTEAVLFATGRRPNTQALGLEQAGVDCDESGAIIVDEHFATNVPGIHAVGDVINRVTLTPVALAEGEYLARRLFNAGPREVSYALVPSAVFSRPNLATVGLTEEQARERHGDIQVFTTRFTHLKHTLTGAGSKIFMKLITDRASDRVVGLHMLGDDAAEIIQGLAVALQTGATKADFDATIGIHPSAAEEFVTLRTPRP